MARKKIALIGGGQIGQILALTAAQKQLGDIVTLDIPEVENPVKGKMLDIADSRGGWGFDANLKGTSDFADIEGSDVVIVTAGLPRKPGMTRDDLLDINVKIISNVAREVKNRCPNAFCIIRLKFLSRLKNLPSKPLIRPCISFLRKRNRNC